MALKEIILKNHLSIVLAISFVLLIAGCGEMVKSSPPTMNPPKAQITVLYDAFGKNPALQKDRTH